jgi:hypothetical protein
MSKNKTCWNCGKPIKYHENGLSHYRCECGVVEPETKIMNELTLTQDQANFLYSLMPGWVKDHPKGLCATMYGTLSQEGDKEIGDKVRTILNIKQLKP